MKTGDVPYLRDMTDSGNNDSFSALWAMLRKITEEESKTSIITKSQ
jgi:hypothetical protein